jgi:hypothetical protein
MIISGLYEALLDSRMLDFVQEKVKNGHLTLDMRCRILMVILIGNLDLAIDEHQPSGQLPSNNHQPVLPLMEPSPVPGRTTLQPTSGESSRQRSQSNTSQSQTSSTLRDSTDNTELEELAVVDQSGSRGELPRPNAAEPARQVNRRSGHILPSQQTDKHRASPWEHMEELLYHIRLYDERSSEMGEHIGETKTKLRTMLLCQYSFGSTVGAPVLYVPSCSCHNIH